MHYFTEIKYSRQSPDEIAQVIRHNQITYLSGVPGNIDVEQFYIELTGKVGLLVKKEENPLTGKLTEGWNKIEYNADDHHQSFKYSNKRQPLHTDYGYVALNLDMTFFYCEKQADYGGATHFMNTALLLQLLQTYELRLYEQLTTLPVLFGRAGGKFSSRTGKIIDFDDAGALLNWNYYRVSKENSAEVLEMCEKFHHFLEDFIVGAGLLNEVLLKKGEAVFFYDKRILHGRNSFLGDRKLMKAAIVLSDIEKTAALLATI